MDMMRTRRQSARSLAIGSLIVFAFSLTGCTDFAPQRLGSIRTPVPEGRPTPAPALARSEERV